MPSKLYAFEQLGILLVPHNSKPNEWIQDCPLCGADDGRFGVNEETLQCGCRKCGFTGNLQTLIREFYTQLPEENLEALASHRDLKVETLQRWGVRWNPATEEYVIPVYRGSLIRTLQFYNINPPEGKKAQLISLTGISPWLFGVQFEKESQTRCLTGEGLWDTMALDEMVQEAGLSDTVRVNGVPGANAWQAEWNLSCAGKVTYLLYDNDHPKKHQNREFIPSVQGLEKAGTALNGEASSVHVLLWGPTGYDPELPSGFDVRDYRKAHKDEPSKSILKQLVDKCSPFNKAILEAINTGRDPSDIQNSVSEPSAIQPIKCESFGELMEVAERGLYTPQIWRDCVATCFAMILSTRHPGDQLWFRLYGPGGCGKTTIAEGFSCNKEHTYPRSLLTGLNSGWKDTRNGKSTSLIPKMDGKCLIWKDADTLISKANIDEILAEFRDLYDRVVRAEYRHGVCNIHEHLSNTVLLCGTDVLKQLNKSFLGERFLDMNLFEDTNDARHKYAKWAAANARKVLANRSEGSITQRGKNMDEFYGKISGFINYLYQKYQTESLPEMSESVSDDQITPICELLSFMRARKADDGYNTDEYESRREMANRLIAQFTKLAIELAAVFQIPHVDDEVMRICVKVFRDTASGNRARIVKQLARKPFTVPDLGGYLGLPETTVRTLIDSMISLGVVSNIRKGKGARLFDLTGEMKTLWNQVDEFGDLSGRSQPVDNP